MFRDSGNFNLTTVRLITLSTQNGPMKESESFEWRRGRSDVRAKLAAKVFSLVR